jgi:hypothetical protein
MALVASGLLNKQVSGMLGISEITVKAHRGAAMRKMGAGSFAELVMMAINLRIVDAWQPSPASMRGSGRAFTRVIPSNDSLPGTRAH